jgi:large subunit ribosomal protein L6
MSKLTNRLIKIPTDTEVQIGGGKITVKGKIGTDEMSIHPEVLITEENKSILVKSDNLSLSGTFNSLIRNMIEGVSNG